MSAMHFQPYFLEPLAVEWLECISSMYRLLRSCYEMVLIIFLPAYDLSGDRKESDQEDCCCIQRQSKMHYIGLNLINTFFF